MPSSVGPVAFECGTNVIVERDRVPGGIDMMVSSECLQIVGHTAKLIHSPIDHSAYYIQDGIE
jgi:hypothetical protein